MGRLGLGLMTSLLLVHGQSALALPDFGSNCASCHSGARGTVTVTGEDATTNPTEACGTPDLGALKVFRVNPGATRNLTATFSGVSESYAGVVKGFETNGVEHCGKLAYTPDASWTQQSDSSAYFTLSGPGTSLSFQLAVGADTPPDFYDLVIAVAGLDATGKFYAESHVYVQVVAAAPSIAMDKAALSHTAAEGSSLSDDTFSVANGGQGTLNYAISSDQPWLTVSPASGSSTGPAKTHTVHYNIGGLAAGSHSATITVSDAAADNSPQTIHVSLTVAAVNGGAPSIVLDRSSLAPSMAEGSVPPDDTFTVAGGGQGVLNYDITSDAAWLTVSPVGGASAGAANSHTIHYDTAALAPGIYAATLTISDPAATNNPQVLQVTLTVNAIPKPAIQLTRAALTPSAAQGSSPADDLFKVANSGGGTLHYTISSSAVWLSVWPNSGTNLGLARTHHVHYDTATLAPGTYAATISVADEAATNNPQEIQVTLTVTAPPPAQTSPDDDDNSIADAGSDASSETDEGGASPPPVPWKCGTGMLGMMPAVLLGVAGLRLNRSAYQANRR